jgi:hypothetical protein
VKKQLRLRTPEGAAFIAALLLVLGAVVASGYFVGDTALAAPNPPAAPPPGPKPPAPTITEGPENLTYRTSAHFEFAGQGQHDGFQCRLDKAPFAPCRPEGVSYDNLALGWHCFEVLAVEGRLRSAPTSSCWRRLPVVIRGEFTIGGNAARLFYPGTSQALDLAITNPFRFAIKVLSVSIAVEPVTTRNGLADPGCLGTTNLSVAQPLRATLVVPAGSTKSLHQLGVPGGKWPVLTMPDLPVNQDACEGATFTLLYDGTAAQL